MAVLSAVAGGLLLTGCQTAPPPPAPEPTVTMDGFTKAKLLTETLPGRIEKAGKASGTGDAKAKQKAFLAKEACMVDKAIGDGTWDERSGVGYYGELVVEYNQRFNPDDPKSANSSGLNNAQKKYCGDLDRVKNAG